MDFKRLMSQMQNTQKMLDALEVTGKAGAEEEGVLVKINGKFEIKELKIKFLPKEADDLEILEDLIKQAFGEAYKQVEEKIKKTTGGMF